MDKTKAYFIDTKNYHFEIKLFEDIKNHFDNDYYDVGVICDKNNKEILFVVYFNNCYEKYNNHCALVHSGDRDFIAVSKFFIMNWFNIKNKYQLKLLQGVLLHELGHFLNGDLNCMSSNNYLTNRNDDLELGVVQLQELKADEFAASEIGYKYMIDVLNISIFIRRKRNDEAMRLAIMEFEIRKEYLLENNK